MAGSQAAALDASLVYTWTGQSAVWGLARGLPVIYEIHDLPTGRLGPLWYRLFARQGGRKRLLVITAALRDRLAKRFGPVPAEQVVVAPNGVDLEQYEDLPLPSQARQESGLPELTTVLCAGHLYAGRGLDLFLDLAAKFPRDGFVWVGGRPEDVAQARGLAARQNLSNVTFTGFVSNRRLPCYQAAADVLLMPYGRTIAGSSGGNSADICSPMKMFDYLAAGRAILSSDLPVIHEVLNEKNAVFAAPDDLSGWAEALSGLLKNPDLRRRLGDQARSDAASYTWQARAERALRGMAF
jgi:glycosyltransferase involved in cell wall biosynthesis